MLLEQIDEISSFNFKEYLKLVKNELKNEKGLEKVLKKGSIILPKHYLETENKS